MANHIKFCSCRQCRYGLRTKAGSKVVKAVIQSNRRKVKIDLKQGKDISQVFSAGYTD